MKALVYDKPGRLYSGIREIPYPQCGPDDVIIRSCLPVSVKAWNTIMTRKG